MKAGRGKHPSYFFVPLVQSITPAEEGDAFERFLEQWEQLHPGLGHLAVALFMDTSDAAPNVTSGGLDNPAGFCSPATPAARRPLSPCHSKPTMITQFTAKISNSLQDEAKAVLKALAEKHGCTVRSGGGSYDLTKTTLKFVFEVAGEEAERLQFGKDCGLLGCKPEDYGRGATINKEEYMLVGFALNRRAFPVKVRKVRTAEVSLFREDVLPKYFHTGHSHAPIEVKHIAPGRIPRPDGATPPPRASNIVAMPLTFKQVLPPENH